MNEFDERKVRVAAICVDPLETSSKLAKNLGLTFPVLVDAGADTIKAFGVFDTANEIAWPAVFVLDGDRRVVWREVSDTYKERPRVAEILEVLDRE